MALQPLKPNDPKTLPTYIESRHNSLRVRIRGGDAMRVRVLGCSGAIAQGCRTTSFLINHNILIDAGTGVGDLTLEEMRCIDHVFLTHSHLDHIAALPLMLDSVSSLRNQPVQVYALPATIAALQAHVFNNTIWPDFSRIPSVQSPMLKFAPLVEGDLVCVDGTPIQVLSAVHTVPAVGYAVQGNSAWWVFTGDTEHNPALWPQLEALRTGSDAKPIGMLVIETAFSNRESTLARRSLHFSPKSLAQELATKPPGHIYPVYITHAKPSESERILEEITAGLAVQPYEVRWLKAGQAFNL